MRSPFRTEGRAFRFVPVVAVAAAAVVVTGLLGPTVAVAAVAAAAVLAVAAVYLLGGGRPEGIPAAPRHVGPAAERRTLLLLDEPPREESLARLRDSDRVLVVSLARTSELRQWVSDVDRARSGARRDMEDAVSSLRAMEVEAGGVVEDGDPFTAIDDALRTFGGDEIVVASPDTGLAERLRRRYAIPVSAMERS